MDKKLLFVAIAGLICQTAALAEEQKENKQWKETETWYQFTDKEQHNGFKPVKARPANTTPSPWMPDSSPNVPPGTTADDKPLTVPYIFMPGAERHEQPATTHIETTFEPVRVPGSTYLGPGWGTPWWGGNNYWGGGPYSWGSHFGRYGWGGGLPFFSSGPSMTLRPIKKIVQSGPSKASGNYFNPSTLDQTASGSYYAGSGNAPRAVPVYQPEAESKDYWGKQGNPLPPEMQSQ